eukprot:TRINITY_DN2604_c0_g1_i2.p1 TRINITY_DN2604_c0_g1~~TRINITY_DN2604_c0_g1_i2.p1  ORF type:complete len:287 (+),score=49.21 TRINITY_DN2604_c0_g1_i2:110-970(+)
MGNTLYQQIPNEIFIATSALSGLFLSGITIWLLYISAHKKGEYADPEANLASKGLFVFRFYTVICLILEVILIFRVASSPPSVRYSDPQALDYGWWVVSRIVVMALVAFAASIYHSHYALRLFCVLALPCLCVADMAAEISAAHQLYCETLHICSFSEYDRRIYTFSIWRSLIEIFFLCGSWMFSAWLTALCGFASNQILFPPKEHRMLAARLDDLLTPLLQGGDLQQGLARLAILKKPSEKKRRTKLAHASSSHAGVPLSKKLASHRSDSYKIPSSSSSAPRQRL